MVIRTNDPAFASGSGSAMVAVGLDPVPGSPETVNQAQLDALVASAIDMWTNALGAGDPRLTALADVQFTVADLAGDALGYAEGNLVTVDWDAAGYGWFIDASPGENSEFRARMDDNVFTATPGSDAFGRMDLLTVLSHELGHVLGLDDNESGHAVMNEGLLPGTRLLIDGKFPVVPAAHSVGAESAGVGAGTAHHPAAHDVASGARLPVVIDWVRSAFGERSGGAADSSHGGAAWMSDFANHLGRSESERTPNAKIKVLVPPAVLKTVADAAKRIGALFG